MSELIESQPARLQQQPENLPGVDELLQAGRLHEVIGSPVNLFQRIVASGYEGDQQQLISEVQQLRQTVMREIALPQMEVELSRLTVKRMVEEVGPLLRVASGRLSGVEDGEKTVNRGISSIEDQLGTAKYAMRVLEDATNGDRVDPDEFSQAVYRMKIFHEVYEGEVRTANRGYEESEDGVRGSAGVVGRAAEETDNGYRHLQAGREEITADQAYYDGMEEAIEQGGARTVAEHQASCSQVVDGRLEGIANLRNNCSEIQSTLTRLVNQGFAGRNALNDLPNQGRLAENVYQLNSIMHRMQEAGSVPRGMLEPIVGELSQQLRQIEQGISNVRDAQRNDRVAIETVQEQMLRLAHSEFLND